MYVRRCPRISASSRTPPRDMRTNFRPVAFAIDLPSEVLPTPGRSQQKAEWTLSESSAKPPNSEELKDAFLDFFETVVIGFQGLFGNLEIADLFGFLFPGYGEQPVEIVAGNGGLLADIGGIFSSRFNSANAFSEASLVMPAISMRFFSSTISLFSPRPSSFWMALIFSLR